jgi:hypothetical protein
MEEHVTTHFSHVLFEAARPVLGLRHGLDAAGDVRTLEGAGIQVAMVAHGTDVRDVADHARRFGYSPYQNYSRWRNIARLAAHNRELLGRLAGEGRPLFVSTPDLLVEFPEAIWLPVVVDPQEWLSQAPPLSIDRRPVVVHAPTVAAVKGTEGAHPELERLATDGVIDYRPLRGLSRSAFCAELRRADIIVDQFGLGSYGVTAVEGMAAGRLAESILCGRPSSRARGWAYRWSRARPSTWDSPSVGFWRTRKRVNIRLDSGRSTPWHCTTAVVLLSCWAASWDKPGTNHDC